MYLAYLLCIRLTLLCVQGGWRLRGRVCGVLGHQDRPQPRGGGAARRGRVGRGEEEYLCTISTLHIYISTLCNYATYLQYLH